MVVEEKELWRRERGGGEESVSVDSFGSEAGAKFDSFVAWILELEEKRTLQFEQTLMKKKSYKDTVRVLGLGAASFLLK